MISKEIKTKIFNGLLKAGTFYLSENEPDSIINFLSMIWPLREMSSSDSRYDNAYEDALKHLISNDDWTVEYTFLDRFNLVSGEEKNFIIFLETTVNPEIRKSKEEISKYYNVIAPFLRQTDKRLAIVDYFEELPIYKIVEKDNAADLPQDMVLNKYVFYKGRPDSHNSSCFYLQYLKWDDFSYKTSLKLFYRDSELKVHVIGLVKILCRNANETWDVLPLSFTSLNEDFCSLGDESDYYHKLKKIFPTEYQSILLGLRDAAFFPKIAEEFEEINGFRNSLIRNNDAEKNLRTMRFELAGINLEERFKFTYSFIPPYSTDKLHFNFDFDFAGDIEHRMYAIIGKNGSGKTKLLSSLAKELSTAHTPNFIPRKPLFGKIITISYSFFDTFEIPTGDAQFNYAYCGLKKSDGSWLTADELLARFYTAIEKIEYKKITTKLHQILVTFIPIEMITSLFKFEKRKAIFIKEEFNAIQNKLSSGQRIQMYIITEILANIREESLILYDEPETHLHPNAITILAKTLFKLVDQFNSFCILATHSPLLIQELYSRNVFIVERENENASIRLLEKECFAENLTVITDDIFGNREISRHYLEIIQELVKEKRDFQKVVLALEDKDIPLSLNARLYIRSILKDLQ